MTSPSQDSGTSRIQAATSGAIHDYFSTRYPTGSAPTGPLDRRHLFRAGAKDRNEALSCWVADLRPTRVLDTGCGDGAFAFQLLRDHSPEVVTLEDIVERNTRIAEDRWRKSGVATKTSVASAFESVNAHDRLELHDLVLCLGVLDYVKDWPGHVGRLMQRTNGTLLFDLPRARTLHSVFRRAWLASQGIRLATVTPRALHNGIHRIEPHGGAIAPRVQWRSTRLHWLVRVDCDRSKP